MKHTLLILAALFAAATLSAKELSTNPDTGMTLSENLGVYTVAGKGGAIILGTKENAVKFMHSANAAFATETINHVFNLGDDKFEVMKDSDGMYVIKVGLGAVKLRPSDTFLFETALVGKTVWDAGKKIWKKGKELLTE